MTSNIDCYRVRGVPNQYTKQTLVQSSPKSSQKHTCKCSIFLSICFANFLLKNFKFEKNGSKCGRACVQVLSDTVAYAVDGAKPGPLRIQNALYVLRCVVHRVVHCFLLAQHVHEMLRNVEDMHPVCTLCILRLYICRHIHVSCIMYALYAYHVCTYVDLFIFLYGVCTVFILHLHICRHACFLVFCMYCMHMTSVHMQTYALSCMVYVMYEYYYVCTYVDIRIVVYVYVLYA